MSLAGKTALITGAGRGIGHAIAETFARNGAAALILTARSADEIEETRRLAEGHGARAIGVACDLADADAVTRLVETTLAEIGTPDVVVNNAGYAHFRPFAEVTPEEWGRTFAVNVTAPYLLSRAFVSGMAARGSGRIINVSSVAGLKGIPEQSAYCASKHALNGLTKVLALELNPLGIGVHAICPGGVRTRLADEAMPGREKSDWMEAQDIADAAVYLCGLPPRAAVDFLTLRRTASVPL